MNLRSILLLLILAASNHAVARDGRDPQLLVFAASSLTNVLGELSAAFEKETGVAVKLSFAASSVLARQIESGATADVFVSADREWMDYLEQRGRIAAGSRRDLAGNRLVLIAPADSRIELRIAPRFGLAMALGKGRLAAADPVTVPAGRYARSALMSLGVWDSVAARILPAENVRVALMYVARGEAPLGIVYATDARIDRKVRVVDTFPEGTHEPIRYPAAAIGRPDPRSADYLAFLASEESATVWEKAGFLVRAR